MKKIIAAACALVACAVSLQAQEAAAPSPVAVSGDVTLVLKKQNSYRIPFDIPEWGWDNRAGASDRDLQWYRVKANLNASAGTPGASEWFGAVTLSADLNAPDQNETAYSLTDEGAGVYSLASSANNVEIKKVELANALVMWRPELFGARPFGVTAGLTSVAQTANAAYTNMFSGDPDNDFIAYTIGALTNKPLVSLDFHVAPGTGIGVTLARGASDFVQNSAGFDDATSFTGAVWAEAAWKGLGFNAAYQYARGNRAQGESVSIDAPNGLIDDTYVSAKWDPKYWASSVNASVSYDWKSGAFGAKPFFGYNLEMGQEAAVIENQTAGFDYADKDTFVQVFTGGAVLSYKAGSVPLRLSGEYSAVVMDSFDGIGGLENGTIERQIGMGSTGLFDGLCGTSTAVYTFSGLEGQYHLEFAADVSPKVTLALFLNGTNAKAVDVEVSSKQKADMAGRLAPVLMANYGMDAATAAAAAAAQVETLAANIEDTDYFGTKWTDTVSFGLSATWRY